MNQPRKPSRPPSLEDLLRLKRAERPDADFWQDFERGLRQKQLASIVEPKPWWLGLSLFARKVPVAGWAASAGAAALFALVSVSSVSRVATGPAPSLEVAVNNSNPAASVSVSAPSTLPATLGAASLAENTDGGSEGLAEAVLPGTTVAADPANPPLMVAQNDLEPRLTSKPAISAVTPVAAKTTAPETAPDAPEAPTPVLLAGLAEAPPTEAEPATFHSSTFFDWAEEHIDLLPQFLDIPVAARLVLDTAQLTKFPAALASIDLDDHEAPEPRLVSSRHARLLATPMLAENDPDKELRARDRVVRRLASSDELYASVTRVGVSGDRLSLRF